MIYVDYVKTKADLAMDIKEMYNIAKINYIFYIIRYLGYHFTLHRIVFLRRSSLLLSVQRLIKTNILATIAL